MLSRLEFYLLTPIPALFLKPARRQGLLQFFEFCFALSGWQWKRGDSKVSSESDVNRY